jgi:hypothetical protein
MYEEISVCYKCDHSEKLALTCIKEPESIKEKEAERFAGLKGLPSSFPWCAIANHSTGCQQLCPDCRRERRGEERCGIQRHS